MSEGPESVLDASALLAYLRDEPGVEAVHQALEKRCAISAVNWSRPVAVNGCVPFT